MAAGMAVAIPCSAGVSGIHIPSRSDQRTRRRRVVLSRSARGPIRSADQPARGGIHLRWSLGVLELLGRAKWIYTVPGLSDWKLFEMPVLGFLGFPPFALECFTMYVFRGGGLAWRVAADRRLRSGRRGFTFTSSAHDTNTPSAPECRRPFRRSALRVLPIRRAAIVSSAPAAGAGRFRRDR